MNPTKNLQKILVGILVLSTLCLYVQAKKPVILEQFEEKINDSIKRYTRLQHKTYGDIYVFDKDDLISSRVIKGDIWEEALCKKMADQYIPGTDVLDIGANLGLNSIRMSQLKKIDGTFHLFEPQAPVFVALHYNTRNLKRKLYNFPLSNKQSILSFEPKHENLGGTSMKKDLKQGIQVNSTTLDSLSFPNPVSFVKMDVEGAELDVLEGGVRFFEEKKPNLIIEMFPQNKEAVNKKLESMKYRLFEHLGGDDYLYKPI